LTIYVWILEDDMPPTNSINDEKPTKSGILTTDDSGRVISLTDYASLHGENNSDGTGNRDRIKSVPRKPSNLFQVIANLKEKYTPVISSRQPKIKCRYCQKFIEREKIKEHNNQAHPNETPFTPKYEVGAKRFEAQFKAKRDDFFAPEGQEGNIAEKLKQALDESRYGGKGMHHRHESDGKFGSTPLHDDYGDESDSD
jgi:hypothetical protein